MNKEIFVKHFKSKYNQEELPKMGFSENWINLDIWCMNK